MNGWFRSALRWHLSTRKLSSSAVSSSSNRCMDSDSDGVEAGASRCSSVAVWCCGVGCFDDEGVGDEAGDAVGEGTADGAG